MHSETLKYAEPLFQLYLQSLGKFWLKCPYFWDVCITMLPN